MLDEGVLRLVDFVGGVDYDPSDLVLKMLFGLFDPDFANFRHGGILL